MPACGRRSPWWRRALHGGAALALVSTSIAVAAPAAQATTPSCGTNGTPTVTALSDPTFYVDTGASPALLANYTGYTVRPSTALSDAYVKLDGFTGGVVSLAPSQGASLPLGQLAANQATTQYFLLQASGITTATQTHTITVYQGDPAIGGTALCARTFTYNRVADTIKASANKVTSVVSSAPAVQVGETITVTVNGNTGTLGAGPSYDPGVLAYTPAVYPTFPAASWKLTRTQLTISPDGTKPQVTYTDRLFLNGASGSDRPYTAVYTFQALAPTASAVSVTPVQQIASGTQVKHTDLGGLSATFPSIASTASLTVAKTGSVSSLLGAGQVTYTVTVSNSGGLGTIDRLVDVMPTGATFVAGSSTLDGTTIPDPSISGSTLVFPGPIAVPAAAGAVPGTRTFRYTLALPSAVGWFSNAAYATVGGSQIDSTASLLDDAKASATVFVDAAPTAVNDTASTPQGTAVDIAVLTNDTLPPLTTAGTDPRVKSVTSVGTPSHGTVTINSNGTLHYTPTAGYTGADTFTYTMQDGKGGASSATVTVNMGPRAVDDAYTLVAAVSTASSLAVVANDGCPTCTVTAVSTASTAIATISFSGQTITYTTKAGVTIAAGTTTDTFTYSITDPTTGYVATATVNIAFSKAQRDLATTPVNTAVGISVAANDTCKTTGQKCGITFQGSATGTSAQGGSLTVTNAATATPTVTYTPPNSTWSGLDTFTYTVDVGTGSNSSNQNVTGNTVLVGPGNQTSTVAPNTTTSHAVVSTAFSNNCTTCSYTLTGAAVSKGTLTLATNGTYTYTPNTNVTGTDSFGFRVTDDATGLTSTATHTITITPVATADTASTQRNVAVTVAVLANDICTSCTVTVTVNPAHGTASVSSNQIVYTPTTGYTGADSLTYRITDGAGSQTTAVVSLTVIGPAPTPTPSNDALVAAFNTAGTVDVTTNDTNAQAGATYTRASNPTHGAATVSSSGSATYTPTSGYTGTDSFTYQVCQPAPYASTCATATVTVLVKPDAVADTLQAVANQTLTGTLASNDTYPAGSAFAKVSNPTHGTVTVASDGSYSYSPSSNYTGPDSFTYQLCLPSPNGSTCTTATVSVMVGPAATADVATTPAGTPVSIDVLANDGCATCTPSVLVDAAHGVVSFNADGTLLYSPNLGYTGLDGFTYLITDESGATASAAVAVTVSPTATNDSAATPTSTAVDIDYRANDACTACTVVFTSPIHGTVTANPNGTAHYTPTAAYTGSDSFTYTLTDPTTGLTATATVTIVVNNAGPDLGTTAYQTPVTLGTSVLANDTCASCEVIAYSTPTHGDASVTGDGSATYTPAAGFFGRDSFMYTATNGSTSVIGTVTVLVGPPTRTADVTAGTPFDGATLTGIVCDACTAGSPVGPSHGSLALAADGTYTYTPDSGFLGADSFTYTVTDATTGLTVPGAVTITVTGPSAPIAGDDSLEVAFDAATPGTTRTNDTGTGTLTSTVLAGPSHGDVSMAANGTYTYTPDAGFAGPDSFTYTLADIYSQSDTATVTITVDKPAAPVATDDSLDVTFDTPSDATTRTNDTGTGALTTAVDVSPAHGSVDLATDGTYTYTPDAGYAGPDSFTYVLADSYDQTDTATVTITVAKPPAPVAEDDTLDVSFDTATDGTTRTNDAGTGPIASAVQDEPTHGTVDLATDGTYTYTPDAGYAGPDSFTYVLADSYDQTDTATVTITVAKPPAPVAEDDAFGTPVGTTKNASTRTNDTGTGTLTTTLLAGPSHGTVDLHADGTFAYTPTGGYAGDDAFTYTLADTYGQSATATVTIAVGKPDPPLAGNDTFSTPFGIGFDASVTGNDSGPGSITWALATDVAHGTLSFSADGSFSYDPDAGYAGPDSFTYTASDGYDQHDTATVTITVGKPAGPTALDDTLDVTFDTATDGTTRTNDTGTGALTSTVDTDVTHGTLDLATDGTYTYTPYPGFAGEDSFTYVLEDGYGQTTTATVTITVAKPAAPTATDDTLDVAFDTATDGTSRANDAGTGALTTTVLTDPTHGSVDLAADGTYTYTPDAGYAGPDSFTYTLADTYDQTATATVTITVGKPDGPTAVDDEFSTAFDTVVDDTVATNDGGTGSLTWAIDAEPTHGSVDLATDGTFTYTPDSGYAGEDTFTYTVTDTYGQSATASGTITVAKPDAPTATDDTLDVAFDSATDGTTRTNDTGTGALTTTVDVSPAHGSVDLATDGTYTYTPDAAYAGPDSFTYTLADTYDQSDTATVTITVAKPPAPNATDDTLDVTFDTTTDGTTRTNDTGTGTLTTTVLTDPTHGTLDLATDGTYTYTPDAPYAGPDSFTYTLADTYDQSDTATVTITVAKPPAPTAGDDAFSVALNGSRDSDTRGNDTGTGALTTTLVTGPSHGTLTLNADGTFSYTAAHLYSGEDTFTYTVSDPYGQTSGVATVTLTISSSPGPIGDPAEYTTAFGAGFDADLTPYVSGSDPLTFSLGTDVASGTLDLAADGTFSFDPAPGFAGVVTFTYTVRDSFGQDSAPILVTITVGKPAPPIAGDDTADVAFDTATDGDTRGNDTGTVPLTSTVLDGPTHGTVDLATDGTYTYTPDAGFAGTDTFTYTLADAYDQSATATVTLYVAKPDSPTAADDALDVAFDTATDGTTRTNDTGTGALTTTVLVGPAHGTLDLAADGTYTYTPSSLYAGPDSFTYTLADTFDQTDTATVTITVAKPAPPIANDDTATVDCGGSVDITPLTNDTGTGVLTLEVGTSPAAGSLVDRGDGTFAYEPGTGVACGSTQTFSYTLRDTYEQTSGVAEVAITVAPDAATATLTGTVWFDRDRDGAIDAPEPTLPGATVTATRIGAVAVALAHRAARPLALDTLTTVSDGAGRYAFVGVPVGRYRITAASPAAGVTPGSDPSSTAAWSAELDAPGGPATLDIPMSGQGTITGTVRTDTGDVIAAASVLCTWSGVDGTTPSSDDVEFEATAGADGTFTVAGVPFGTFSCRGTEPGTGRAATVAATVTGTEPTAVDIVLTGTKPAVAAIAFTGFAGLTVPITGALLVLTGTWWVWFARRRTSLVRAEQRVTDSER